MTYQEEAARAAALLSEAGVPDASYDAGLLLEFCCRMNRTGYLLHCREEMPEGDAESFHRLVRQRAQRIPLQHLTGEQEFMGLCFRVSGQVLIPRQDTEILVEQALGRCKRGMRVLDLCTGSGCIAVSLAVLGGCSVTAADLSWEALKIAEENAARWKAEVRFLQGDLFEPVTGQFDMIISNPPYICDDEIPELMPEVRLHEPLMALQGGHDGLDFYRRIVSEGIHYLVPGGWMMLEIGCDQGREVSELMRRHGLTEVTVTRDLAGLDRVVSGRLSPD